MQEIVVPFLNGEMKMRCKSMKQNLGMKKKSKLKMMPMVLVHYQVKKLNTTLLSPA